MTRVTHLAQLRATNLHSHFHPFLSVASSGDSAPTNESDDSKASNLLTQSMGAENSDTSHPVTPNKVLRVLYLTKEKFTELCPPGRGAIFQFVEMDDPARFELIGWTSKAGNDFKFDKKVIIIPELPSRPETLPLQHLRYIFANQKLAKDVIAQISSQLGTDNIVAFFPTSEPNVEATAEFGQPVVNIYYKISILPDFTPAKPEDLLVLRSNPSPPASTNLKTSIG